MSVFILTRFIHQPSPTQILKFPSDDKYEVLPKKLLDHDKIYIRITSTQSHSKLITFDNQIRELVEENQSVEQPVCNCLLVSGQNFIDSTTVTSYDLLCSYMPLPDHLADE